MTKKFPARIHPVLARDGKTAVVFRRGPSKSVCTVLWERSTDRFSVGQWLKGRIYERRSDISPDGKYLIYFAMNGRWDSETGGSWTAISRTPWLKAIALMPKGDCWNGGGLFTGNDKYWLNDGYGHQYLQSTDEIERDNEYQPENFGGECTGVYYPRLLRDGWNLKERIKKGEWDNLAVFEKRAPDGWVLRKLAHEQLDSPEGKGCYWDEHMLLNNELEVELLKPDWEWAEIDEKELVYAEKGCLYRCSLGSEKDVGNSDLLFDFYEMGFEQIPAPY